MCGQHHNVISMRPSQIISKRKPQRFFFLVYLFFWACVTELITARTIWPFCKNTSYKDPSLVPSLLRLNKRLRSLRLALSLASGCSWWYSLQQTGFILLFFSLSVWFQSPINSRELPSVIPGANKIAAACLCERRHGPRRPQTGAVCASHDECHKR